MGRSGLPLILLLCALIAIAGAALKSGQPAASGSVPKAAAAQSAPAKEESLSVTATLAPIDLRQPQHLKTATFALG